MSAFENRPYSQLFLEARPSCWRGRAHQVLIDDGNEARCHEDSPADQTMGFNSSNGDWAAFMLPAFETDFLDYPMDTTAWPGYGAMDSTIDDTPRQQRQQQQQQQQTITRLDTREGGKRCDNNTPRGSSPEDTGRTPLLACPYFRSNPLRYHDCQHMKLRRIKDVKQHISRRHKDPRYRCSCSQDTSHKLPSGAFSRSKTGRRRCGLYNGPDTATMLSAEQRKLLSHHYTSRNKSIESQWYHIWDIIFPRTRPPRAIYMDRDRRENVDSLRSLWEQKRSELVSRAMARLPLGPPPPPCVPPERDLLYSIVDSVFDELEAQMFVSGDGSGREETRESTIESAIASPSEFCSSEPASTLSDQESRTPCQTTSSVSTLPHDAGRVRVQVDTINPTLNSEREDADVFPGTYFSEFDNASDGFGYGPWSDPLENGGDPGLGSSVFHLPEDIQPEPPACIGYPLPFTASCQGTVSFEPQQDFTPSLSPDRGSSRSSLSPSVSPSSVYPSSGPTSVSPASTVHSLSPPDDYVQDLLYDGVETCSQTLALGPVYTVDDTFMGSEGMIDSELCGDPGGETGGWGLGGLTSAKYM